MLLTKTIPAAYSDGVDKGELKKRRGGLDLSQQQLADLLSVHVMTISRWERGERPIPGHLAYTLRGVEIERLESYERKTATGEETKLGE